MTLLLLILLLLLFLPTGLPGLNYSRLLFRRRHARNADAKGVH
jgi:hypothetical protein